MIPIIYFSFTDVSKYNNHFESLKDKMDNYYLQKMKTKIVKKI